MLALLRSILIKGRDQFLKMVELMLNMYVSSILLHDVPKFVCFVLQLRFLITVKSCTVKGFYMNNI